MYWITSVSLVLLAKSSSGQVIRGQPQRRHGDFYAFWNTTSGPPTTDDNAPIRDAASDKDDSDFAASSRSVTVTYDLVPESHSVPLATTSPSTADLWTSTTHGTYVTVSRSQESKPSAYTPPPSDTSGQSGYVPPSISPANGSSATDASSPGPNTGAPSHPTGIYTLSGSSIFSYAPTGTAPQSTAHESPSTPKHGNSTCGGATLNVLDASLDWWHTETYTYAASTISIQYNANDSQTGWTLLPATTTFDISAAITEKSCTPEPSWNDYWNATFTAYGCFTTPTPVAAATSVVTIDGIKTNYLNATTGNGTDIPNIAVTPPPASATIGSSGGAFATGTNFVYFSDYEIMSEKPTTYDNGSTGCATSTQVYNMSKPYSFRYFGRSVNGLRIVNEGVTGDVHPDFLDLVGHDESVEAGSWAAKPTVLVVVKRAVVAQAVLAAHTEISDSSFDVPTPTLPGFLTPATAVPTDEGKPWHAFTAHVEVSDDSFDVPTTINNVPATKTKQNINNAATMTADQGGKPSGSGGSSNIDDDDDTAMPAMHTAPGGDDSQSGDNNDDGYTRVTATVGATKPDEPTNAAEVLSAALSPTHSNPTASAIMAGMGGTGTGASQRGDESGYGGGGGGSSGEGSGSQGGNGSGAQGSDGSEGSSGGETSDGSSMGSSSGSGSGSGGSGNDGDHSSGSPGSSGSSESDGESSNNGNSGLGSQGNNGNGGSSGSDSDSNENGSSGSGSSAADGGSNGSGSSGSDSDLDGTNANAQGSGSNSNSNSNGGYGSDGSNPSSPAQVLTYDGATITAAPVAAFVVNGQTAVPGGSAITISGTVISIPASANAVVVDGSTMPIPASAAAPTSFEVDALRFTHASAPGFAIGGQTLRPGGPVITVDGTQLSLAPGATAMVIDGSMSAIRDPATASRIPLITLGSRTLTANAATQFYLAPGQTLVPGGRAVVSGTTLSLASDASALVVDGKTKRLAPPVITQAPDVTFRGTAYQADAGSSYYIGGQVLTPGGAITLSGTEISLLSDASELLIDGKTHPLPASAPTTAQATITAPPLLTIDNTPFAPNAGATYNIHSHLLSPGGTITFRGPNGLETLALAPSASALIEVFSGQTFTSTFPRAGDIAPTAAPILSIGGETFTAIPGDGRGEPTYVVSGVTLTPGEFETVTLDGTTYLLSLAPQATVLRIETKGAGGEVTATSIQTLFPASGARGTVYMTAAGGAEETEGAARASPASESADTDGAGLQSGATGRVGWVGGVVGAVGVGVLAVWL